MALVASGFDDSTGGVLVRGSTCNRGLLKRRLYQEGLKQRRCAQSRQTGGMARARSLTGCVAAATVLVAALWWRRHPSACPYWQRFWVQAPHPLITRGRLLEALAPAPGERILEVGPGTGYYSLDVARALLPGGTLELFDLQREMLDHTLRRARDAGLGNLVATQGDARELPYEDDRFDAAYLVAVLGEIPGPGGALTELARVVRPGGRVIVGELAGDPHFVRPRALEQLADSTGLRLERRLGPQIGYFAVLRVAPQPPRSSATSSGG